jgi:hypothetical protein
MQTLQFRTLDGRCYRGTVKKPSARLGSVAAKIAARAGLAGTFEMIRPSGATLDPNTELKDLPQEEDITLVSELTPAA